MTELTLEPPKKPGLSDPVKGLVFGLGAVLIWGSSLAFARAGMSQGLAAMDFALFRYGTAGIVVLPWLLLHQPAPWRAWAGPGASHWPCWWARCSSCWAPGAMRSRRWPTARSFSRLLP